MQVGKDASTPYFLGWSVVIIVVFAVGLLVELGAKKVDWEDRRKCIQTYPTCWQYL
jgi:hypothetical protein